MRLRQLVIAARTLEPYASQLRDILALGEPYRDPGVSHFGLENVVFPVGDQFLEIVAPTEENTAAGRFIDRQGEGGYMVILQTDDLAAVRERGDRLGVRRVWNADHDQISASHFHPRDVGAAILSIDEPRLPESWLWGGPDWQNQVRTERVSGLAGAAIEGPGCDAIATRWADLLDIKPTDAADTQTIALDDATLRFTQSDGLALPKVTAFDLVIEDMPSVLQSAKAAGLPHDDGGFTIAGTRLNLVSETAMA